MNKLQIKQRKLQFEHFAEIIQDIPGAIVECGVGCGHTLEFICNLFSDRRIIAIDSFKGFPEPNKIDGQYAKRRISTLSAHKYHYWTQEQTRKFFIQHNIDGYVLSGFFEDILPTEYTFGPIALLHLDCDLYNSYKAALSLYQYLVNGGILAFDEYKSIAWIGATRAIDEFLEQQPRKLLYKFKLDNFEKFYLIKNEN